jgi:hypothetical protein
MTLVAARCPSPQPPPSDAATRVLARQLAIAGLRVEASYRRDTCELTIAGALTGKSLMTLDAGGQARWYYEPATGPTTRPATLTAIITHLLGASPAPPTPAGYRALPVKGQVGRSLQDHGLTVVLRVSEDWESFEATTDIDITSPTHPQLGTITLSDDAALDWRCNWQAAFGGNPATLTGLIIPILRPRR